MSTFILLHLINGTKFPAQLSIFPGTHCKSIQRNLHVLCITHMTEISDSRIPVWVIRMLRKNQF